MFPTLLIVDDEPSILKTLGDFLGDEGFVIQTAPNGYEALKSIEAEAPDLVLLDIWMPGIDGIDTLKEIRKKEPHLPVIMITGHGTIDTAVNATKCGAFDFIEKPLSIDKILITVHNALSFRQLEEENRYLKKKNLDRHAVTGNSGPVQQLRQRIFQAAPTDAPVLVLGENGTGKELVARSIHQLSSRSEEALICVNCATFSPDRIESELFGHERGAFGDATTKFRGSLEMAHGGTLFLDQVADLPPEAQGKLLRFLEDGRFKRVGGSREITVNVRIIAATSRDLQQEITAGRFREDLFYRLDVVPVTVPPLRERNEDLPVLAQIFLDEASQKESCDKTLSEEALRLLCAHDWPGNVRELKNLMERLAITAPAGEIGPGLIQEHGIGTTFHPDPFAARDFSTAKTLFTRRYLRQRLAAHHQNLEQAAASCGLSVKEFSALMEA